MIVLSYHNADPAFSGNATMYVENRGANNDLPPIATFVVNPNPDQEDRAYHVYIWNKMEDFENLIQPDTDGRFDYFDEAWKFLFVEMSQEQPQDAPNMAVYNEFKALIEKIKAAKAARKFEVSFDTNNSIFDEPNTNQEIARVLRNIADNIEHGVTTGHNVIKDQNGNNIGHYGMIKK